MRKLYLIAVGLVPGILAMLSSAGYSQTPPGSTPPPGMTGNPELNQQSDRNGSPASRSRHTGTMENGAGSGSTPNGTPSSTMAKDAENSSQSIAPGSAPKGSTPPQMARSSAADRDAGSDTSTTPGSAAPNDAMTSSGAGRSVTPNGMDNDSAPKGSTEPQMAKPDAREASRMDSDAPASALPPPGATEGADANKP